MLGTQFEFMPFMIQGPAYNCSAIMPPGPAWSEQYGIKQIPFGIYSIAFGVITEMLYVPCMIGLGKDLRTSCFKIMFSLSIIDMIAIVCNCIIYGVLLLQGAVYCSNPMLGIGVGIISYCIWMTASAICLLLGLNRLCELLDCSRFFTAGRTNIYIGICVSYGLFMALFTRPVSVNSTNQAMLFSPMIPGHGLDEYVNWPHSIHNIVVAFCSCLFYISMSIVLLIKSRSAATSGRPSTINNAAVYVQVVLINLIGTLIYVYMQFFPTAPAIIIAGHVCWQFIHGSPPFIYLALNKKIRQFALKSIGLGAVLRRKKRVQNASATLEVVAR